MYPEELILRFKRLQYQLNRLKTTKWASVYSEIELNRNRYITFNRFCNECEEYFSRMYRDEVTDETIQEIFDKLN